MNLVKLSDGIHQYRIQQETEMRAEGYTNLATDTQANYLMIVIGIFLAIQVITRVPSGLLFLILVAFFGGIWIIVK